FFAAVLGARTEARLSLILRGYLVSAVIASLAAIVGYFRLVPHLDALFLLYDRARGTFNDPNVLGAFLVLPGLIALQTVLIGRRAAIGGAVLLALFATALLLSFSRGAWGQFVVAGSLVMLLTFITGPTSNERARVILLALIGMATLAAFIATLLSIDVVADLFKERANLEQSYDLGHTGRFGRYLPAGLPPP